MNNLQTKINHIQALGKNTKVEYLFAEVISENNGVVIEIKVLNNFGLNELLQNNLHAEYEAEHLDVITKDGVISNTLRPMKFNTVSIFTELPAIVTINNGEAEILSYIGLDKLFAKENDFNVK